MVCAKCGARCKQVKTPNGYDIKALPGELAHGLAVDVRACIRCGAPRDDTLTMDTNGEDGIDFEC